MPKYIVTGHITTKLTEEEVLELLSESYVEHHEFSQAEWELKLVPLKGRPAESYYAVADFFNKQTNRKKFTYGDLISVFEHRMKPATLNRVLKQLVAEGKLHRGFDGKAALYENNYGAFNEDGTMTGHLHL